MLAAVTGSRRRGFRGVLGSESLRIYGDNALRLAALLLLVGPRHTEAAQQQATTGATLAYAVPWILLSVFAGLLADRWSKGDVLRGLKLAEAGVMVLAAVALQFAEPVALYAVVTLVGTTSALASPAKFGALPELLPPEALARGNGVLLLFTYVAMILGTASGGVFLDVFEGRRWVIGALLALLALVGWRFARSIPLVPAAGVEGGFGETVRAGLGAIRHNARLRLGLLGNVWYWALATLVLQDLIVYAKSALDLGSNGVTSGLVAVLALGVGAGGLLAGLASRGRTRLGQIPLGGLVMTAASLGLGLVHPALGSSLLLLVVLGLGAGVFSVPIAALIQAEAPAAARGAVLAMMNLIIFAGIGLGSVAAWGLAESGLASTDIFLVTAAVTGLGSAFAALRGPRLLRRVL